MNSDDAGKLDEILRGQDALRKRLDRIEWQVQGLRDEIRGMPNYRRVRRAWMLLGDYVRRRFPKDQHEAKKQWIRRRLTYGRQFVEGEVRADKVGGCLRVKVQDADHLLGFEE